MLRVNVVAHQNSIQLPVIPQKSQPIDPLGIRWHIQLVVHLEMRAFQAEEVVLAVTAKVGVLEQLLVADESSCNDNL